jgi:hypothetical protein
VRSALAGFLAAVPGCGQLSEAHAHHLDLRRLLVPAPGSGSTSEVIKGGGGRTYTVVVVTRTRRGGTPSLVPQQPPTTYQGWAALFFPRLGVPLCRNNLIAMVAWEVAEGSRGAWNPLATTLDWPGATSINSAGVRSYPSLQNGLDATVETLHRRGHGYEQIVGSLSACADPYQTALAINRSDWCSGCVNGQYVIGLVARVAADFG